jgi:hypothetical protein
VADDDDGDDDDDSDDDCGFTRRQRIRCRHEPSKTATMRDLGTSSILVHSLYCDSPSVYVCMMPSSRKWAFPNHDWIFESKRSKRRKRRKRSKRSKPKGGWGDQTRSTNLFFELRDRPIPQLSLSAGTRDNRRLADRYIKAPSQDPIDRRHGMRDVVLLTFPGTAGDADEYTLVEGTGYDAESRRRHFRRDLVDAADFERPSVAGGVKRRNGRVVRDLFGDEYDTDAVGVVGGAVVF